MDLRHAYRNARKALFIPACISLVLTVALRATYKDLVFFDMTRIWFYAITAWYAPALWLSDIITSIGFDLFGVPLLEWVMTFILNTLIWAVPIAAYLFVMDKLSAGYKRSLAFLVALVLVAVIGYVSCAHVFHHMLLLDERIPGVFYTPV